MKFGTGPKILIISMFFLCLIVFTFSVALDVPGDGQSMPNMLNELVQHFSLSALLVFLYSTFVLVIRWLSNPTFGVGFGIGIGFVVLVSFLTIRTLIRLGMKQESYTSPRRRGLLRPPHRSRHSSLPVVVQDRSEAIQRIRAEMQTKEAISLTAYTAPRLLPEDQDYDARYVTFTNNGVYWVFLDGEVWKLEE